MAANSHGLAPTSAVGPVRSRLSSSRTLPSVTVARQTTERDGNVSPFIECGPTAQAKSAGSLACSRW